MSEGSDAKATSRIQTAACSMHIGTLYLGVYLGERVYNHSI